MCGFWECVGYVALAALAAFLLEVLFFALVYLNRSKEQDR